MIKFNNPLYYLTEGLTETIIRYLVSTYLTRMLSKLELARLTVEVISDHSVRDLSSYVTKEK